MPDKETRGTFGGADPNTSDQRAEMFKAFRGETDDLPIGGFMVPRAAIEDGIRRACWTIGRAPAENEALVVEVLRGVLPYLRATQEHQHVHYHVPDGHELHALDSSAVSTATGMALDTIGSHIEMPRKEKWIAD